MFSNKNLLLSGALLACCVLLHSCIYYQRYSMPKTRLNKINTESLSFYVIDAAHPLTKAWYVAEMDMKNQRITGFLSRLSDIEALEVGIVRNRRDGKNSRNDVLLYTSPRLLMGFGDTLTTTIPFDQIERIEVHEPDFTKTLGTSILMGTAGFFLFGVLALGIN